MDSNELEWMNYGLCSGQEALAVARSLDCRDQTDLFFPERGHNRELRAAKEICNACVVQPECLEYALAHQIDDGVWGGTSGRERKRIKARRKRLAEVVA